MWTYCFNNDLENKLADWVLANSYKACLVSLLKLTEMILNLEKNAMNSRDFIKEAQRAVVTYSCLHGPSWLMCYWLASQLQ